MAQPPRPPEFFDAPDGARIAWRTREGRSPTVVFLGGFRSDMNGNKARALDAWAHARGQAFLRFDYQGHGASGGRFEDCSVGTWSTDAIHAIDHLTSGPLVLVGSSMGGWIMSLIARARPERVAGMVGIAAAPNFVQELMLPAMTSEHRETIQREGVLMVPSQYDDEPYPITRKMIDDASRHDVLGTPIEVDCPVRLIHGLVDPDVPWQMSMKLADAVAGDDVIVTLIKDGDHRLSKPAELSRILEIVSEVVDLRS